VNQVSPTTFYLHGTPLAHFQPSHARSSSLWIILRTCTVLQPALFSFIIIQYLKNNMHRIYKISYTLSIIFYYFSTHVNNFILLFILTNVWHLCKKWIHFQNPTMLPRSATLHQNNLLHVDLKMAI
jgi:hypothetical protein